MGMQNYKCKFHAFMVYDSELYACKLLELGSHRKIRNVSQPIVVGTHSPRYIHGHVYICTTVLQTLQACMPPWYKHLPADHLGQR